MANSMNRILVLNAGSSSLKYALYTSSGNTIKIASASGIIEKIGQSSQNVKHTFLKEGALTTAKFHEQSINNHNSALKYTMSLLSENSSLGDDNDSIAAVGHRVVHGGEQLTKAQLITKDVIDKITHAVLLAPLHNPANLNGINTAIEIFPSNVKQVAVFDTSFHSTIPKHAYLYSLPYKYYAEHSIRKYGFHGTSHEYVMNEASKFLSKPIKTLNLITCHIGAGASITCVENGKCVDTTMGMTPTEGLIMATRCGDIDPAVIFYLVKQLKLPLDKVERILQHESGWFGLSGHKDARDLERSFEMNNETAVTTVKSIVYRIRKYLGAYYWNLGGDVDAIVFTAGLGENWATFRKLCLQNTSQFGFLIDNEKNQVTCNIKNTVDISSFQSQKKILVVPTNEEYSIASKTLKVLLKESQS